LLKATISRGGGGGTALGSADRKFVAGTNALASRSGVPITGSVLVREKVESTLRDGKVLWIY
jgi:hypothetical protein